MSSFFCINNGKLCLLLMARQGSYTYKIITELCENRGLKFNGEDRNYSKRERIKVFCECSGEREILVSGLGQSSFCCKRKSKLGENNPSYNIQKPSTRDWETEILETCSRLDLVAVLPEKLTAHSRIIFSCPHGVVKDTTVLRFVERKYCCKSQASKAHDPEMKRYAASIAWRDNRDKMMQRSKDRWDNPEERKRHSERCSQVILEKRQTGWINPGWGWKPNEDTKNLPCSLYIVKYKDDEGIHYKLGVTTQTIEERFRTHLVEIIDEYQSTFEECYSIEQEQLKYAKENGWRYSSHSTTELIKPEGIPHLLTLFSQLKCSQSS